MVNEEWQDNELTSHLWELISQNKEEDLKTLLQGNPVAAHVRSADGRGPMWWAHEYKRPKMIEFMRNLKVSETRTDKSGLTPLDT